LSTSDYRYLRVAVLWHDTLTAETTIKRGETATVGDKGALLMVPDSTGVGEKFKMFGKSGGQSALNLEGLSADVKGRLNLNGKDISVQDARKSMGQQILIGNGDWGTVDLGPCAIYFQAIEHDDRVPGTGTVKNMETSVLAALFFAATLHFAFIISAFILWTSEPEYADIELEERFMKVKIDEKVEDPPLEVPEEDELVEEEDEDTSKAAEGEEGKFGEEDKLEESKVPVMDGELVKKVENTGALKALSSNIMGNGAMQNVFGNSDGFDSQINAAMAGADGELVIGNGTGGMGMRGGGTGGGGTGFGQVHGMGRVPGKGRGVRARLGGKKKSKKKARVRRGKGNFSGFCKESDILKVVKRRQRGIQFCYEKELARNPSLNGKVTMGWIIGTDGKAMRATVQNSSLGNKTVEGCMVRNINRWRFKKPEGGLCKIRFPFVFNAGL